MVQPRVSSIKRQEFDRSDSVRYTSSSNQSLRIQTPTIESVGGLSHHITPVHAKILGASVAMKRRESNASSLLNPSFFCNRRHETAKPKRNFPAQSVFFLCNRPHLTARTETNASSLRNPSFCSLFAVLNVIIIVFFSKESFALQLQPGVLRIQISKVKGDQKVGEGLYMLALQQ